MIVNHLFSFLLYLISIYFVLIIIFSCSSPWNYRVLLKKIHELSNQSEYIRSFSHPYVAFFVSQILLKTDHENCELLTKCL